jgi:hypothetical protein
MKFTGCRRTGSQSAGYRGRFIGADGTRVTWPVYARFRVAPKPPRRPREFQIALRPLACPSGAKCAHRRSECALRFGNVWIDGFHFSWGIIGPRTQSECIVVPGERSSTLAIRCQPWVDLFHLLQRPADTLLGVHGPDLLRPVVFNLGLENTTGTLLSSSMVDHRAEWQVGNGIAAGALLCPKRRS